MESGDIVWIRPSKAEGLLTSASLDAQSGKEKYVVYVECDGCYIVDPADCEFLRTIEEDLEAAAAERRRAHA